MKIHRESTISEFASSSSALGIKLFSRTIREPSIGVSDEELLHLSRKRSRVTARDWPCDRGVGNFSPSEVIYDRGKIRNRRNELYWPPPSIDFSNGRRSHYLLKRRQLFKFGMRGSEAGCFTWPRGLAVGPDNSIVVADSSNHRVQVSQFIESLKTREFNSI